MASRIGVAGRGALLLLLLLGLGTLLLLLPLGLGALLRDTDVHGRCFNRFSVVGETPSI